jgi:hypothetical protein
MIFLWVSLALASALKAKTGSLGDLLTNPTNVDNLGALFSYILVLGFLFISFKVSSSFSTDIAGFNWAAMIPAGIAGAGANLLGGLGRQTFGKLGFKYGEEFQERSKQQFRHPVSRELYDFTAKGLKAVGKKDFNALRNTVGGAIAASAGIKKRDDLLGKPVGGFAGERDKQLEKDAIKADRKGGTEKQIAEQYAASLAGAAKTAPPAAPVAAKAPNIEKPVVPATKQTDEGAVRQEAINDYLATHPEDKAAHEKAVTEVKLTEKDLEKLKAGQSDTIQKFTQSMKTLKEQQTTLRANKSDSTSVARAEEVKEKIKKSRIETARELKTRGQQIREATAKSHNATDDLQKIEKRALDAMRERANDQRQQNKAQTSASASTVASMQLFTNAFNKARTAFTPVVNWEEKNEKDLLNKMRSLKRRKRDEERARAAQNVAPKPADTTPASTPAAPPTEPKH